MSRVKITLKRSLIGKKPNQRETVRSLGLKRINHSVVQEKSPAILGMIKTVSHMVAVEDVE